MAYPKYNNPTNASGIHITEASPIDDRYFIRTEEEVAILENVEVFPSVMYDGMIVQFHDTKRNFIWVESDYGLMAEGYTYPEWYDDIQGQDYSNKLFNFVLVDKVLKIDFEVTQDNKDIFIDKKYLPYHIARDISSAVVMLKSSQTEFTEQEFPDSIQELENGITIILNPKPVVGEIFKITIY